MFWRIHIQFKIFKVVYEYIDNSHQYGECDLTINTSSYGCFCQVCRTADNQPPLFLFCIWKKETYICEFITVWYFTSENKCQNSGGSTICNIDTQRFHSILENISFEFLKIIILTYFCRPPRIGLNSTGILIIAENKLKFMMLTRFVQQDNFHKWTSLLWFLKSKCNWQK